MAHENTGEQKLKSYNVGSRDFAKALYIHYPHTLLLDYKAQTTDVPFYRCENWGLQRLWWPAHRARDNKKSWIWS